MTRKKILAFLTAAEDFVSGEEISRALDISRAAVWKNIKSLREDGFCIDSRTNRGYYLRSFPDILTEESICPYLDASVSGEKIICLQSVDSTNSYLKKLAAEGEEDGTVVVANRQTGGRGRQGREFFSPPDMGVYLSVLLKPSVGTASSAVLTAFSAVAVCEAIRAVSDVSPEIKWVNDILIGGRKVCGILTELSVESESGSVGYVVVGVGVNVGQRPENFPSGLRGGATSLYMESGKAVSRARLAAEMVNSLNRMYHRAFENPEAYIEKYRKLCTQAGRAITVIRGSEKRNARTVAIADDCGLVVEYEDGSIETLNYGEISIRT